MQKYSVYLKYQKYPIHRKNCNNICSPFIFAPFNFCITKIDISNYISNRNSSSIFFKVLPTDFRYSVQQVKDNKWIAKHDGKFSAVEIFSDIKRVLEFVYHVPRNTNEILLCINLMFSVFTKDNKVCNFLI